MSIQYLLDEHLSGLLWRALNHHNAIEPALAVDVLCIGHHPQLPDPEILNWVERERRIVVSEDRRTMIGFYKEALREGRRMPGLFILRRRASLPQVLDFLVVAAFGSEFEEWENTITFIP